MLRSASPVERFGDLADAPPSVPRAPSGEAYTCVSSRVRRLDTLDLEQDRDFGAI